MRSLKPKEAAEQLGISYPTIKQWIYEGKIRANKTPGGHYRIPDVEIERLTNGGGGDNGGGAVNGFAAQAETHRQEPISVRNKLLGEVIDVRYDGLFAEVQVKVGDQIIVSIITSGGCRQLGLKKGMSAYALFKATEVMIGLP